MIYIHFQYMSAVDLSIVNLWCCQAIIICGWTMKCEWVLGSWSLRNDKRLFEWGFCEYCLGCHDCVLIAMMTMVMAVMTLLDDYQIATETWSVYTPQAWYVFNEQWCSVFQSVANLCFNVMHRFTRLYRTQFSSGERRRVAVYEDCKYIFIYFILLFSWIV